MPQTQPSSPSLNSTPRIHTWIIMLLAWNIALLCVGGFSLYRLTIAAPSAEDLATVCAEAFSSLPPQTP